MVWFKGRTTIQFILSGSFLFLVLKSINSEMAFAETMFEGFYRVVLGTTQIGFVVQRYEYDSKKKQFISTYFVQTNNLGEQTLESLNAKADNKFQPISYKYTVHTPKLTKTIDAHFKGMIMTATISEAKKEAKTIKRQLPEGTFLSTFLGYLILQNGYSSGKSFSYSAVAEEDAESYNGVVAIKEKQTFLEQSVFRITNTFKGIEFVSFVSDQGEVLGTQSPSQKISTELTKDVSKVAQEKPLPAQSLKLLFGQMPTGKKNILFAPPKKIPEVLNTSKNSLKSQEQTK